MCWWSRRLGGITYESAALTCSVSLGNHAGAATTPAPRMGDPNLSATFHNGEAKHDVGGVPPADGGSALFG
jgi:hypothetical protein